ncbi:MAG: LamG domain-containing protein, partial [Pseudomonadota bacterium]|nr:LamG domain-containing protein [Pseudomonadota bacterium]
MSNAPGEASALERTVEIMAYASAWSVRPGEQLDVMVSCDGADTYSANVVRLLQPDCGAEGTPFHPHIVDVGLENYYAARVQFARPGSLAIVPELRYPKNLEALTMSAYVLPTTPGGGRQIIMGDWSDTDHCGYSLAVDENGCLALFVGNGIKTRTLSSGMILSSRWYFVAVSMDIRGGEIALWQEPLDDHAVHAEQAAHRKFDTVEAVMSDTPRFCLAGRVDGATVDRYRDLFDGKIDRPRIAHGKFSRQTILQLDADPLAIVDHIVAAWDFSRDIPTAHITDIGPNAFHGVVLN